MASIGLALGLGSAAAGLGSAVIGSNAASTAAGEQQQTAEQALTQQQQEFQQAQANQQPFLGAGQTSIGQILAGLQSGQFGPGSTGTVPSFTAPTLAQVQQYPGYQFTQEQGDKGILAGAAAGGGAISGGTLKSLDQYNTNLANNTYGTAFNQALQTYASQLSGYQAGLQGQAQQFSQLAYPASLGAGAASSINQTGQAASTNIGNILASLGNAQAAGTIGQANAISGGIGTALNGLTSGTLLQALFNNVPALGGGQQQTSQQQTSPSTSISLPAPANPAGILGLPTNVSAGLGPS